MHVPVIRIKLLSMRHWYLSLCMGRVCSADQTPPIQSDKYQCRMAIVIFSWWWAHGCPKNVEKRNKYIKQDCAPSSAYLQKRKIPRGSAVPEIWRILVWRRRRRQHTARGYDCNVNVAHVWWEYNGTAVTQDLTVICRISNGGRGKTTIKFHSQGTY